MKKSAMLQVGAVLAISLGLSACGAGNDEAKQSDAPAAHASMSMIQVENWRDGVAQASDNVITVQRTTDGVHGVVIRQSAVRVDFTVAEPGGRVLVRQGEDWVTLPTQSEYSVMVGPGSGVSQIVVTPRRTTPTAVTVTRVVACETPGEVCAPLPSSGTP